MNMQNLFSPDLLLQVRGITPGRAEALVPAVLGLIGIIIGFIALARAKRNIPLGRPMAIIALGLGLISIILSGLHLARATGAIGTGSGRLGAIVALVFGLIGAVAGWRALAKLRRMAGG
jgi:multidrug transporter EmrE-like cation transporter